MSRKHRRRFPKPNVTPTGRPLSEIRHSPNPVGDFEVMDAVMQCWCDLRGTAALMLCVLDGDPDEAAAETMRRHLETDLEAMSASLDAAWEAIIRRPGAACHE